nr:hypothetical protein [Tanacetum cinerariifolium]
MDWFCKKRGITKLKPQDLEGPAFKIVKVFYPDVIHLQYQIEECHKLLSDSVDDPILRHNVSKQLPLGGPPGQVTIQSNFFFNKDLEYLKYGSKGRRPALSISKMKAAYYLDVRLEQMVPDQFWVDEECKYDLAAIAVRTHIWILSVVRIEVFSMYGYDYMKKIVLHRADLSEHVIAERDFKQCVEDFHLGIESYQTQLNLTKPQWDATGFEAKRSSKTISLGHYSIMLASSRTVKMKMEILLEPTSNKLLVANELTNAFRKPFEVLNNVFEHWVFNSLVHSFCALSALRRSSLRTTSTAMKPNQGYSLEFYLITGRIPTIAAAGQRDVNSQLHAHTSISLSMTR